MWTEISGAGVPVVLLNGGPGMPDYLAPLARLLDSEYRVHRFEPRGCGRSSRWGPYTLRRFVSDIEDLRRHWGFPRWAVVGHSWGVDLGLAYALAYPARVTALAGLAGGRVVNDRSWSALYHARLPLETPLPEAFAANAQVNRKLSDDWRVFCRRPALLKEIAGLDLPTLFVLAENDIRPHWPTMQLAELMPNAKAVTIAGAEHTIWAANERAVRGVLLAFLADVASG